jgi:hypothetical protein
LEGFHLLRLNLDVFAVGDLTSSLCQLHRRDWLASVGIAGSTLTEGAYYSALRASFDQSVNYLLAMAGPCSRANLGLARLCPLSLVRLARLVKHVDTGASAKKRLSYDQRTDD